MQIRELFRKAAVILAGEFKETLFNVKVRRRRKTMPAKLRRDRWRHPGLYSDPGISRATDYVLEHGAAVFPHSFVEKYDAESVEVCSDEWSGLQYVMHSGYPLYMKRESGEDKVRDYYNNLSIEQDPLSPHCYETKGFAVDEGSAVFDIGCAEGIFALFNIEKASKVFLFESSKYWLEALRHTFAKWKDKVVIINKFASDTDGKDSVTVDTVAREYGITGPVFLKIDVEGMEKEVLRGAAETLGRRKVKAAVCTYHRRNDHAELSRIMENAGFEVRTSAGHMLFIYGCDALKPPYFRRGMIYCTKNI